MLVIKRITLAAGLTLGLLATSCTTNKNLLYMQGEQFTEQQAIVNLNEIKVQPQDRVSIVVNCKEQELARQFNLVQTESRLGQPGTTQSSSRVSSYTVDAEGDIDFPIVGKIHIAGLTRQQISEKIADILKKGGWISDPVVTVEFANLHFTVLGSIASPGVYSINYDNVTLLEGIAQAGDLQTVGEREILVIREENGIRKKYNVNLKDDNLFESPVYNLQQNDVIYIRPNNTVARQASDNPNNFKSLSLWMSLASFVTSMAILIFK